MKTRDTEATFTTKGIRERRTPTPLRALFAAVISVGVVTACLPIEIKVVTGDRAEVLEAPAQFQPSLADNPLLIQENVPVAAHVEDPLPLTGIQGDVPAAAQLEDPLPLTGIQEAVPAATDVERTTGVAAAVARPVTRIVAESIDLDAEVVEVGWETLVQDGVPTNVWRVADYAAGWHKNSMLPGQGGNIVLSAHHNIKGQVFRYTADLEPGDLITLYDEEQSHAYQVADISIVKDKGEPEAVRQENARWVGPFDAERLTLITCWPFNSNTHRLIVIAKPAGQAQAAVD